MLSVATAGQAIFLQIAISGYFPRTSRITEVFIRESGAIGGDRMR